MPAPSRRALEVVAEVLAAPFPLDRDHRACLALAQRSKLRGELALPRVQLVLRLAHREEVAVPLLVQPSQLDIVVHADLRARGPVEQALQVVQPPDGPALARLLDEPADRLGPSTPSSRWQTTARAAMRSTSGSPGARAACPSRCRWRRRRRRAPGRRRRGQWRLCAGQVLVDHRLDDVAHLALVVRRLVANRPPAHRGRRRRAAWASPERS